jgi:Phospholipase_D-nuclease N-terminal
MVIGADYPFMEVLWTMILFFCWVAWIWVLVYILSDVFIRHDIGGWAKAAWMIFMILLPFLGVLVYLIGQHDHIAERREARLHGRQPFDGHVRPEAAKDPAAEIAQAARLRDDGVISGAEFEVLKEKALAT